MAVPAEMRGGGGVKELIPTTAKREKSSSQFYTCSLTSKKGARVKASSLLSLPQYNLSSLPCKLQTDFKNFALRSFGRVGGILQLQWVSGPKEGVLTGSSVLNL
jgi:hypothetical protein